MKAKWFVLGIIVGVALCAFASAIFRTMQIDHLTDERNQLERDLYDARSVGKYLRIDSRMIKVYQNRLLMGDGHYTISVVDSFYTVDTLFAPLNGEIGFWTTATAQTPIPVRQP